MKTFISFIKLRVPTAVFGFALFMALTPTPFVGAQGDVITTGPLLGGWDEVGFRSASGGGIPWDLDESPAEAKLVLTQQGDPWVFWVDGFGKDDKVDSTSPGMMEYVDSPVPFHFQGDGSIYYKQYIGATLPWVDHMPGGSDLATLIGTGGRIDVATGINGEVFVAWVTNLVVADDVVVQHPGQIFGRLWDGQNWSAVINISADTAGIAKIFGTDIPYVDYVNDKPSVIISGTGAIVVSYTHLYFNSTSSQRDIIVKKQARHNVMLGGKAWTEVVNSAISGLVNDTTDIQFSGGISDTASGDSIDSSIAIAADGLPVVAWSEFPTGKAPEIFVKKWDGQNWNEYGTNSASLSDDDGLGGVSNDASYSIQPDLAINGDHTVLVWVNWNNWDHYFSDGQAGIYVKKLDGGAWVEYVAGVSATEAGIAPKLPPLVLGDPEPEGYGWYYQPNIALDAAGQPLITWNGHRQNEGLYNRDDPKDGSDEAYRHTCYTSYYHNNGVSTAFHTLTSSPHNLDPDLNFVSSNIGRDNATTTAALSYLPHVMFDGSGNVLMAYTWREASVDAYHFDSEIFVQKWSIADTDWVAYGRGSESNGNTTLNQTMFGYYGFISSGELVKFATQIASVDYDGVDTTESDIILLNNYGEIFHFSRQTGEWSSTRMATSFGIIYEIKGEPEIEFDVAGPTVLAYLDDATGEPYVKQWVPDLSDPSAGVWSIVGGASANPGMPGNLVGSGFNLGISVQQGPGDEIMLVYLAQLAGVDVAYARLWDGATWGDAGTSGIIDVSVVLATMFYSDFDGETAWANVTEFDPEAEDADPDLYDTWFYQNKTSGEDLDGLLTQEVAKTTDLDGVTVTIDNTNNDVNEESSDKGIAFIFKDPDSTSVDGLLVDGTKVLSAELWYNFYIEDDDTEIIIQFDHLMMPAAAFANDLYLHIEIDGVTLDINGDGDNDPAVVDDAIIAADATKDSVNDSGKNLVNNYADVNSQIYIDTKLDLAGTGIALAEGKHKIKFVASIDVTAPGIVDVYGMVALDNVVVHQRVINGSTDGAINTTTERLKISNSDIEGNHIVGPPSNDPDKGAFDLQGCLQLTDVTATPDPHYFVIEDLNQEMNGPMEVGFRFNAASADDVITILFASNAWDDSDPTPKVTDVYYAEEVDFSDTIEDSTVSFIAASWWSQDDGKQEYWHVKVRTPTTTLIPAATDIKVIIYYEPAVPSSKLLIDNLVVLGVNTAGDYNATRPIATLLPTATTGVSKKFGVGITGHAPSLSVYNIGDSDIIKDGRIVAVDQVWHQDNSFPKQMDSGYFSFAIKEYNTITSEWESSVAQFAKTTVVDFFGVGKYFIEVAAPESYILTDIATGIDSFVWIALQHATTDPVDILDDEIDEVNQFDIHPYSVTDPFDYWSDTPTTLDVQVWRWDPTGFPIDEGEKWVQMFGIDFEDVVGGKPPEVDTTTLNGQLISKNGQRPILAWTDYTERGIRQDSYAVAWDEHADAWRPLGNATKDLVNTGSVQNGLFWTSLGLEDMTISDSGDPIVTMKLGNLDSFGLREFNSAIDAAPHISIFVENLATIPPSSTTTPTNALRFAPVLPASTNTESQLLLKITNNGVGDLTLYSIKVGGFSGLPGFVEGQQIANNFTEQGAKPFKFDALASDFVDPVVIPDGTNGTVNSITYIVTLDTAQMSSATTGIFEGALVIHSDAVNHPTHEYALFYEVPMTVVLENSAKIDVSEDAITFENAIFGSGDYPRKQIEITNVSKTTDEDSQLRVTHWGFENNYYQIISAQFFDASVGLPLIDLEDLVTPSQQPVGYIGAQYPANLYINKSGSLTDDIILDEGDKIILTVEFNPLSVDVFDDVLSIGSDDTLNPLVPVNLFGLAESGAALKVEVVKIDGVLLGDPNVIVQDKIYDFGSVINGDTKVITVRLTNPATATSDALIRGLSIDQPVDGLLKASNYFNVEHTLAVGAFVDVDITFSPLLPDVDGDQWQGVQPLVGTGNKLWPEIAITTDVPDDELFEFALSGVAIPRHGVPELSETLFVFDETALGQSATQTFTIKNIGAGKLSFDASSYIIPQPSSFTVTKSVLVLEEGEESDPLTITFAPLYGGELGNTVYIQSVDTDYPEVRMPKVHMSLRGVGVNPVINVTDDSVDGIDDDHLYAFGAVGVGLDSAIATITIKNTGEDVLNISPEDITLVGDPNIFTYTTNINDNDQLIDEDTRKVYITFHPNAVNDFAATLQIKNDLSSEVTLSGSGVIPGVVSVYDVCGGSLVTEIDFVDENGGEKIFVGEYKSASICLSHSGVSDIYITGVEVVTYTTKGVTIVDDILGDISSPFIIAEDDKFSFADEAAYHILQTGDPTLEINVDFNPATLLDDDTTQYLRIMYASSTDFIKDLNPPIYIDLKGASKRPLDIHRIGKKEAKTKYFYYDEFGNGVTVKLSGAGTAFIQMDNTAAKRIIKIDLSGTNHKSKLSVKSNDNGDTARIGQIVGSVVKSVTLSKVVLDGDLTPAGLYKSIDIGHVAGSITLHSVTNGATIKIGDSLKTLKVSSSQIFDGTVYIDGKLSSFSAKKCRFEGGLRANKISKILLYSMNNADISVVKYIKSFALKENFTNSRLLAGFDLGTDARLGGAVDTLYSDSEIETIYINGAIDHGFIAAGIPVYDITDYFGFVDLAGSTSGEIGKVTIKDIANETVGDEFGIAAVESIGKTKVDKVSYSDGDTNVKFKLQTKD